MRLKVVIHPAPEGGFWAEVPMLPGCVSEGETLDETLTNIRKAVEGWLLVAEERVPDDLQSQVLEIELSVMPTGLLGRVPARTTDRARKALRIAGELAIERQHSTVSPEHLLLVIAAIERGPGRIALERLGLNLAERVGELKALLSTKSSLSPVELPTISPELDDLLEAAQAEAKSLGHNYIGTEHLVLGMLLCGSCAGADFLASSGITIEKCRHQVLEVLGYRRGQGGK